MARSADDKVVWDLGDQRWSQDLKTGAFDLVDFKGLGAPAKRYHPQDLAALVGARVSVDSADRGRREAALFPGQFKFSPISGKPLPDPPPGGNGTWIPPFGHDAGLVRGKPRGLRLTEVPLSLPPTLTHESRPHVELQLPAPGNYQFLVGPFATHGAVLLAIEFSRGLLYRWLPVARSWQELLPGDRRILGETSLTDRAWGMTAPNPQESRRLFLPTIHGLAALSLNLIAPDYRTQVVGTRCVGAPAQWHDGIYVPMQRDGRVVVHAFDAHTLEVIHRLEAPGAAEAPEWTRPIVDSRQIIWMSSAGQLLVKLGGETPEVSFLAWEPGVIPRFDLGSPYVSADGHVWQQCFRDDASGGRFLFVQLGRLAPEVRSTSSPRLSTGSSNFQLETLFPGDPWREPAEGMDSQADEVVIPLLEVLPGRTLLCARVPSTSAVASVFSSDDAPHVTTFELRGEREVQFARERLTRPWLTRPFVYDGSLYLYHPDRPTLPGWRMS